MGFLSKVRKRIKKQIRPNNMMIGNIRKMPKRPNILGRGSLGDSFLFGKRPRGNLGSDFRMPQIGGILREGKKRRGGFGFGLGEAIRRLKEQGDMGMPSMIAGGTPGFYDNMRENMSPGQRLGQMPQPIPRAERMPSFNPTIFGQPIGDMDFSNMPDFSQIDLTNLQVPNQMPMAQDLPEVAPIGMMPQMRMGGMQNMQPRMMMQEGEDVSLERELFSLQSQLENLKEQLRLDRSYNDDQAVINTSAEMAAIQKRIQEIMEGRPQLAGGGDFPDLTGDGKVTQADILKGRGVYAEGDEVILSIDEKINNELKARGYPMDVIADLTAREKLNDVMRKNQNLLSPEEIAVYASSNRQDFSRSYIPKPVMGLTRKYAEGDEVMMMEETEMMAPGGDEIEASLMEVQGMQPETQMLDQYVQMVIEMVQAGASEAEVIESLRQAGLDDDDIAAVFQAVMETLQGSMEQGGIDAELAQLS